MYVRHEDRSLGMLRYVHLVLTADTMPNWFPQDWDYVHCVRRSLGSHIQGRRVLNTKWVIKYPDDLIEPGSIDTLADERHCVNSISLTFNKDDPAKWWLVFNTVFACNVWNSMTRETAIPYGSTLTTGQVLKAVAWEHYVWVRRCYMARSSISFCNFSFSAFIFYMGRMSDDSERLINVNTSYFCSRSSRSCSVALTRRSQSSALISASLSLVHFN